MTDLKERRHRAIADLIRSQPLPSQEDLARRLAGMGFAVTQATISRDLEQLGAVKVRREGMVSYALPDQLAPPGVNGDRLRTIIAEWVRSIDAAGNLVVIKTPPGSAHLVGIAIDEAKLTDVVGTICGDDTIFVACTTAAATLRLASDLATNTPAR
jgi:transcriptional regulator of arginine metabolism